MPNAYTCRSIAHGMTPVYLIPQGDDDDIAYAKSTCSCWSHCHHGYKAVSYKKYKEYRNQ